MRIGVHAHAAFKQRETGVERYARRLLETLLRLPEAQVHEWTLFTPRTPPPHADQILTSSAQVLPWPLPVGWTQLRLAWALPRAKLDRFFSPAHALPPDARNGIVVVHGVEFERMPHAYSPWQRSYLQWVTASSVRRARRIIAASHATKRDLIDFYSVDENRITVIYHGADEPPRGGMRIPPDFPPFLLALGRLETKKNPETLIEAFEILVARGHPHHLIFVGGDGWGSRAIRRRIGASPARGKIVVCGFLHDEVKWAMLEAAKVLVFPSWCEGFGFPAIEAQHAGVPVVASNTSSLPEVLGTSATLVDPSSALEMADAVEELLTDETLRRDRVARGSENVKRFSWNQCARETLAVLTHDL